MVIEKHSSDFAHLLLYHVIPMVFGAGFIYGAIYLIVRLVTRPGKSGNRKRRYVGALNRQQRRQQRAMKRHKRRY